MHNYKNSNIPANRRAHARVSDVCLMNLYVTMNVYICVSVYIFSDATLPNQPACQPPTRSRLAHSNRQRSNLDVKIRRAAHPLVYATDFASEYDGSSESGTHTGTSRNRAFEDVMNLPPDSDLPFPVQSYGVEVGMDLGEQRAAAERAARRKGDGTHSTRTPKKEGRTSDSMLSSDHNVRMLHMPGVRSPGGLRHAYNASKAIAKYSEVAMSSAAGRLATVVGNRSAGAIPLADREQTNRGLLSGQ